MVRPACVGVSRPPKAVEEKWFICWLVLRGPSKPVYVSVHSNTVNAVDSRAECAFTVSSHSRGMTSLIVVLIGVKIASYASYHLYQPSRRHERDAKSHRRPELKRKVSCPGTFSETSEHQYL